MSPHSYFVELLSSFATAIAFLLRNRISPKSGRRTTWNWISNRLSSCWEDAKLLFTAITVTFLTQSSLGEARVIVSRSMCPTYEVGDRLLTERVSYLFRNPRVGEVVFFKAPPLLQGYHLGAADQDSDGVFVKRVVATAGDWVAVRGGRLLVNGAVRDEDFVVQPHAYGMDAELVPQGYVFVMGDNRNNSFDSRSWGPLPIQNILGRGILRYWPRPRPRKRS